MNDVEVRQLRYFVAVAEELHFGRAAERLGMAQPPLSRAISRLERRLGVQLLIRSTRAVSLTPAGQVLLREARVALVAVSAAANRARHAGQDGLSLRVALKADYDAGMLPAITTAYREECPEVEIDLVLGGRGEQATALRAGVADVGLLATPFDGDGLDVEPLVTEPRVLALAADDPLAARSVLRLADLAGRTLPDGSAAVDGGTKQATSSEPRHLDLAQVFSLVELGSLVWFPPASLARRHARPGVAYRTVEDLTPSTLVVAWPQASTSPSVATFVRAATRVAAERAEKDGAAAADHALALPS
jgi:DNA-binding transcriptional LysR family regulator